jgi:hypothetical protein
MDCVVRELISMQGVLVKLDFKFDFYCDRNEMHYIK